MIAQRTNHTCSPPPSAAITDRQPATDNGLLRERALAVPPTWKEVDRLLSAFAALPGAAFVPIDREDTARIVALEAFVTAARSHDLSAEDGRPIPPADVLAWAMRTLDCASWAPVRAVVAVPVPAPAPVPAPVSPSPLRVSGAGGTPALHPPALRVLERLRVASVERTRPARGQSRRSHHDPRRRPRQLGASPYAFFGESVVALTSPWP